MESNEKELPNDWGEFYAAHADKFEKRNYELQPKIYYSLAVVAVLLVIFPGVLPLAGWLVRTAGVIAAIVFAYKGYMCSFDIFNRQSGGKVTDLGRKKFKRGATDTDNIIAAFLQKDFAYLSDLPLANSAPIQIHFEEDAIGREIYCLLTTYNSSSQMVGLADVITLTGEEYTKNVLEIKTMCSKQAKN